jgi:site-specific recombinase XerD
MATSNRRLASTPSRRKAAVEIHELVTAFLSHHLAIGHSTDTVNHYRDSLRLFERCLDDLEIPTTADSLTNATMNSFASWLRTTPISKPWRGKTERSIYGVHGAIKDAKVWLRWLESEEYILKAPKVPVPKLPTRLFPILSDEDLDTIFKCPLMATNTEQSIRNRALISFMLDTAVRLAEVAGVAYDDIDLRQHSCLIRGKGQKERMVYFSEGVADSLKRFIAIRGSEEGSFFWLTTDGVRMVFKRIQEQVGLPIFTAHQLRHTSLTSMVKQNMDLHSIKRIAGHASVTTTEAYLALAGEDIREKHNAASPFDRVSERVQLTPARKRRLKAS